MIGGTTPRDPRTAVGLAVVGLGGQGDWAKLPTFQLPMSRDFDQANGVHRTTPL